ncbi:Trafficking protein particle complex subunit 13 [Araneus ventricosus]|uniref:Trafficking protein particle complex subunit 13 n=1 Tax=Araneus ventricosus TaxID=182803 RepID=A0A4Y2IB24_ARAVE|nr:Trafficking protein particle complex subunit 13 [Araneus ventricosus]
MENREKEHLLALKVMRLTRPSLYTTQPIATDSKYFACTLLNEELKQDLGSAEKLKYCNSGNLLMLPQSFGNIYLGETFSCYMSVHNDSPQTVTSVQVQADLQIGLQKIVLTGQRGNYCSFTQLNPDESVDDVIHHEVKEIGTHILACTVNYTTMNNEKLHFRKFFKFQVSKPLDVKTKFYNAEDFIQIHTIDYLRNSLVEVPGMINMMEVLCRSRRVQRHPPEFGLLLDPTRGSRKMPNSKETAPKLPDDTSSAPVSAAPVPILMYQLPRNPCIFSGDDQQDANKWLKDFQRIATYNHWDDQLCLANIIFYLAGTAQQWFNNNEDTFTNWTMSKNSLNIVFRRTDNIFRQAERLLDVHSKLERCLNHTSKMYSLCAGKLVGRRESGPAHEGHSGGHVSDTVSSGPLRTVDEPVKRCLEIESLQ